MKPECRPRVVLSMNSQLNQTVRQIFDDYRYELVKVGLALEELSLKAMSETAGLNELLQRAEKLETLIDLYAYLLACQGQRASS